VCRLPSITRVRSLVDITAVEVLGDCGLRLAFQDGTIGDVALGDHRSRCVFEPLRAGTVAWPNGADMAPAPLYEHARRHPVEPAPRTR
jgi:hypothetical protein